MATRGTAKRRPVGATDREQVASLFERIYQVVRRIPPGTVATYGQVAELAGIPRGPRVAGAAMRASSDEAGLPWHRVVGKKSRGTGKVSILDPIGGTIQRKLLEAEGIVFTRASGISLAEFGWLPHDEPVNKRKRR